MKYLCFFFLFSVFTLSAQEKELPNYIFKIEKRDSVFLTSKNTLSVPIHIVVKDSHANTEVTIPLFINDSTVIFAATKKEFSKQLISQLKFKRYYGNPFIKEYDTLYAYRPPFKRGKRYKVLQGYHGKYTHKNIDSKYALDFQMPIGDTICAARNGIVVNFVDTHKKGGKSKKFKPYANSILIYHPDGTFAQYVHLKHKGVLVKEGDSIKQGQPIALSGNTGWSTEPHLHFSVYIAKKGQFVSIPTFFNGISGEKLRKGKRIIFN